MKHLPCRTGDDFDGVDGTIPWTRLRRRRRVKNERLRHHRRRRKRMKSIVVNDVSWRRNLWIRTRRWPGLDGRSVAAAAATVVAARSSRWHQLVACHGLGEATTVTPDAPEILYNVGQTIQLWKCWFPNKFTIPILSRSKIFFFRVLTFI